MTEKLPDDLEPYAEVHADWPHIHELRVDMLQQIAEQRPVGVIRRVGRFALRGLRYLVESYNPEIY